MTDEAGKPNPVQALGARVLGMAGYLGGMALLLGRTLQLAWIGTFRPRGRAGKKALWVQMVRVGVRSAGIVCLVQIFIGVILALQLAPPLENPWGQSAMVPNIIGIAGFRMMGPIITAVVLSGFAGASIAAELGTMVVAEEVEALQAHALDPVRFLVVPRVMATFWMTILLTIIADWMIALGGYLTAAAVLEPKVYIGYWDRMRDQLKFRDFFSGLIMAGVFGIIISLIACFEGLRVRGGAEGVGRATTMTVVYSIVGIILSACVFTMIFYVYKI